MLGPPRGASLDLESDRRTIAVEPTAKPTRAPWPPVLPFPLRFRYGEGQRINISRSRVVPQSSPKIVWCKLLGRLEPDHLTLGPSRVATARLVEDRPVHAVPHVHGLDVALNADDGWKDVHAIVSEHEDGHWLLGHHLLVGVVLVRLSVRVEPPNASDDEVLRSRDRSGSAVLPKRASEP